MEKIARERLWNRNYIQVMISNFLLFFSFYLLTPLLPLYLDEEFSADKAMIGYVLSGYIVAALIVRPFSGYVVDAFDRKRVLVTCFFFFFILFTGYIGAGTLLMFGIVRTLHGLPFGAATVANSTVAIDVVPSSRRNEGVGYYGLSNNLAMAVAPTVAIWVYGASGSFQLLFWISLAVAFLGFVSASSVKPPKREKVIRDTTLSLDRFFLSRGWLMAVNILLFAMCWGVMANYVAIYAKEVLGITEGTGTFFMLLSFGLFASRMVGVKSLARGRLTQNALQGALISAVGYTLFALLETQWAFYTSAILIGLGNGRMYPAFLNMFICVARNDQRGTANSSILTSWDLGMGLGMLAGGVLTEYCGYGWAFWFTAASQITGTILIAIATRKFFIKRKLHD